MNEFAAIQERFAANLDVESDQLALTAFASDLVEDGRLTSEARIAIYRNNTKAVRINALKQIYPICLAILGERCFRSFVRDHSYTHPS